MGLNQWTDNHADDGRGADGRPTPRHGRASLLRLAAWFEEADPDRADALAAASYALHPALHLEGRVDEGVAATTSWWQAEADRSTVIEHPGARPPEPVSDHRAQQARLRDAAESSAHWRRAGAAQIRSLLAEPTGRRTRLDLSGAGMEVLMELLTAALGSGDASRRPTSAGDLEFALRLHVVAAPGAGVTIRGEGGELTLEGLRLLVTPYEQHTAGDLAPLPEEPEEADPLAAGSPDGEDAPDASGADADPLPPGDGESPSGVPGTPPADPRASADPTASASPVSPTAPASPDAPETPAAPSGSAAPFDPRVPAAPENPGTPDVLAASQAPDVPAAPQTPAARFPAAPGDPADTEAPARSAEGPTPPPLPADSEGPDAPSAPFDPRTPVTPAASESAEAPAAPFDPRLPTAPDGPASTDAPSSDSEGTETPPAPAAPAGPFFPRHSATPLYSANPEAPSVSDVLRGPVAPSYADILGLPSPSEASRARTLAQEPATTDAPRAPGPAPAPAPRPEDTEPTGNLPGPDPEAPGPADLSANPPETRSWE